MQICTLAYPLAFVSALTLGFALPAHAQNHATARKPAQAQESKKMIQFNRSTEQVVEKLKRIKDQNLKILDPSGREVSWGDFVSNLPSYKDDITMIGYGEHKFQFRSEMIENGTKGIKIFVTHVIKDGAPSGQVITLSPEMTKKAIEQRFKDAIESILVTTNIASTGNDGKRNVASIASQISGCIGTAILISGILPSLWRFAAAEPMGGHTVVGAALTALAAAMTLGAALACVGVEP